MNARDMEEARTARAVADAAGVVEDLIRVVTAGIRRGYDAGVRPLAEVTREAAVLAELTRALGYLGNHPERPREPLGRDGTG